MRELIFIEPVFKETIWGGKRLHDDYGYDIPSNHTGECWAISAHPNGDCRIASGEYKGLTLSELYKEHGELFGSNGTGEFPLLVKMIDAKADLSIQVHPDDVYAAKHENGSLGKTECWYILDCDEDAQIVIGHNAKDHEEVKEMIENKRWDEFIRVVPVHKGDFFQIVPGTVHAIKKGTVILETQQSSDVTYRVYDYDRLQNGKPRDLHIKQSIDVIRAPFVPDTALKKTEKILDANVTTLVECEYYRVKKIDLEGETVIDENASFVNVSVLEGEGKAGDVRLKKGMHFIVPCGYGPLKLSGNMMLIISAVPQRK